MLCLLCAVAGLRAATKPTISDDSKTVWYIIQFCEGGNALTAQGEGEKVKTAVPTGKASQLWKLEGSHALGFRLISKNGMVLYTSSTEMNGMFHSASNPSVTSKFKLTTTTNSTHSGAWVL